jgi:hypothetical protein
MKDRILIALAGFMGGIGPSLAELASLAKDNKLPEFSFFVGAVIIGIMGMSVALIAKETVPWKAFTQGMGAPTLFSSATTAVTSAVASGAFMFSPVSTAYAEPYIENVVLDSTEKVKLQDSVIIMIEKELYKKSLPGSTIVIEKDDFEAAYIVPDTDTVQLKLDVYNPAIRRALFQGLLPMQDNLTKQFEAKLMVKEVGKHK